MAGQGRPPLSATRLWICALAGVAVVALDLYLCGQRQSGNYLVRLAPAAFALLVFGAACRWDVDTLGLRLRPVQGYAYWIKASPWMAAAMGLITVIALTTWWPRDWDVKDFYEPPEITPTGFFRFFAIAPLVEEPVYRIALCVPLARLLSPWPTIALSGAVFAHLHFVYGNPHPVNFFAGYLLAWSYLHSGSILVPITMHGFGNLLGYSVQMTEWWKWFGLDEMRFG